MPRKSDKRERLVHSAKKLMFQQGYNLTTLADIAEDASVPLGNVYYYFKTKESIGDAVIASCSAEVVARLDECNQKESPVERLCRYVDQELESQDWVLQYGDRSGALAQELAKDHKSPLASACAELLNKTLQWMHEQFRALGCGSDDAMNEARKFMAALQGSNLLAMTFKSKEQHNQLCDWLKSNLRKSTVALSGHSAQRSEHHSQHEADRVESYA